MEASTRCAQNQSALNSRTCNLTLLLAKMFLVQHRVVRPVTCTATNSSTRTKAPNSWSIRFGDLKRRLTRRQLESAPTSLLSTLLLDRDRAASLQPVDVAIIVSESGDAAVKKLDEDEFEVAFVAHSYSLVAGGSLRCTACVENASELFLSSPTLSLDCVAGHFRA